MIEVLDRSTGSPKAIAKCDECDHAQYETCDYERQTVYNRAASARFPDWEIKTWREVK